MKKIFLIITFLLIAIAFEAQNNIPVDKKKQESKETKYCCPKCDHCDTKKGKCPTHNSKIVKEGKYCCEGCKDKDCKDSKCHKSGKKKNCKKEDSEKQK